MHASFMLKDRTNQQLLVGVKNLVGQECNTTAYLIAHLSEIEVRGLHLEEGCPSRASRKRTMRICWRWRDTRAKRTWRSWLCRCAHGPTCRA